MWGELALSIKSGNTYTVAILTLAFIASIISCERFIVLQFIYNLDFDKFISNLRRAILATDYPRAMSLCKSASQSSLPRIALRALEAAEHDPASIRSTIEEDAISFIPRLESRLALMPALATMVMLVGILGTIDSLWWSFHSLDVLDTIKKQTALANGIAGSLNPSAAAIMASLLILASHQILRGMAMSLLDQVHYGITVLSNLLVPEAMAASPSASRAASPKQPASDAITSTSPAASTQEEDMQSDDAFDDTVVDDIKDEEEII